VRRLALALLLVFGTSSCISEQQWHRFRSHGTATMFSTVMGGVAVAIGGSIGLVVAGAAVVGGIVIDQTLEPEPEVRVRTVTTIIEWPPLLPDGAQPPPLVKSYVDKNPSEAPSGGYRLPNLPNMPAPGYWERVLSALKFLGALLLVVPLALWLLRHPMVRAAVWGAVCWVASFIWHTGAKGVAALKAVRQKKPTDPPEET
jgi:hypothetical protein